MDTMTQVKPVETTTVTKAKKPIYKRWWAIGLVAIFAIGAISQASGNGGSTDTGATHADKVVKAQEAAAAPTKADKQSKPKAAPKPSYTMPQKQAIASATDYLSYSAFSKAGLIEQLSSKAGEGFALRDAQFAVNHITVDWNEQAAASAKEYLKTSAFSRQGLIEQLSSKSGGGFTHAQAVYGVNKAGL